MIRIALAKGRLSKEARKKFLQKGLGECIDLDSRKLVFTDEINQVEYVLLKAKDVVTYVENGVADLGVVGSDVLMESNKSVYELFDLGFGKCKFSIACKKNNFDVLKLSKLKVATKYPIVAKKYFDTINKSIEIIPLGGSVELAPLLGLSDVIVDIVETGNTLKANELIIVEDMYDVSARLICNRVSYRFNQEKIINILNKLKEA